MFSGLLCALGVSSVALMLWVLWKLGQGARGRPPAPMPPTDPSPPDERVSVLIPARNEEANIRACVQSALQGGAAEVIVFDDQSTDCTAQRVRELAQEDERVRLLQADAPPPVGWMPKPRGLHALAAAATGEVLLFLDADVVLRPGAIATAVTYLRSHQLQAMSCIGRRSLSGLFEQVFEVVWPPLILVMMGSLQRAAEPDSGVVFASGAFFLIRASAYRACGGWAAVRSEITEDVCLAARIKAAGLAYRLADAPDLYDVRFYATLRGLIEGWSKNAYRMVRHLGHGHAYIVGCLLGLLLVGVVPWLIPLLRAAGFATNLGWFTALAPAAVSLSVAAFVHRLSGRPVRYVAALPLAALLAFGVLLNSTTAVLLRRQVVWKGRRFLAGEP